MAKKTPRGNAQEDNNDKRELQCLHHETVNLYGAHLVLLGNLVNRFPIKRNGANNCNESEVKEEQQKQEIQHKASFLESSFSVLLFTLALSKHRYCEASSSAAQRGIQVGPRFTAPKQNALH